MQKVVELLLLHAMDPDALVVFEKPSYGLFQAAVHAPLAVERVGLTLGT